MKMNAYKISDNFNGVEGSKVMSPHHFHPTNGVGPSDSIKTYHKTHDSFAEAFAKRTRSTVFGTDRKVNFCNGQITSSLIPPKLYEFNGE